MSMTNASIATTGARELSLDQLAARVTYQQRKQEPTQNAHGVRVGDLFYESWGYDQTNVDFYEVVELKGKATAILREIGKEYIDGFQWSGTVRPCRGQYRGEPFQSRTSVSTWNGPDKPQCGSPRKNGYKLSPTQDE